MPAVAADKAVPFPLTIPLTVVERVRIGVVPPEEVPAKPLAEATEIEVTAAPGKSTKRR